MRRELQEVELLMEELEDALEDAQEEGDLQDDFVLEAMTAQDAGLNDRHAAAGRQSDMRYAAGGSGASNWDSEGHEDYDDDDVESLTSEDVEADAEAGRHPVGSIASTYWRPERNDRNEALSMIDERYVLLAAAARALCVPPPWVLTGVTYIAGSMRMWWTGWGKMLYHESTLKHTKMVNVV